MTDREAGTSAPQSLWQQTDHLLSGGAVAVRGVALSHDDEIRTAVAVTLSVAAAHAQANEDGSVTATVLLGPGEALGISRWLREAAQAADEAGAPLYDWEPGEH